jgi:hypothetical protein
MGHPRRWAALAVVGLVAAACGSAGSAIPSPSAAASAAPSSSSAAPSASLGPATAQVSLVGTAGLTGPVTTTLVICGRPSLDGPQIFFQGQKGTNGPAIVMFLGAAHMEVRVATGSADTLKLRSFEGTGVSGFDAASGAQFDSQLTETTAAGAAIGDLGTLTSISGTIDCGGQQPGTANVVVTGLSPQGPLSSALTDIQVECTATATDEFVSVSGLTSAGANPVLMFVTGSTGRLQVAVEAKASASFYTATGAGLVTLGTDRAHVEGDVIESVATGVTPHTLHVAGDATCGLTTHQ